MTVVNVASRGKAVSQAHRIHNLRVCLSAAEIDGRCACSTQQLHLKRRTSTMPVLRKTRVSRAHHTADLTHLSVCVQLQRTPDLSDQLTASSDLTIYVRNYPQSAVTFCGCLFMAVLCVN